MEQQKQDAQKGTEYFGITYDLVGAGDPLVKHNELVRKFNTGATRSADAGRPDPEGFLSPLVIDAYCQYMGRNRLQPDGTVRDSDNWQKGIPLMTYMKGLWRHMHHAWTRHRGYAVTDPKAAESLEDDLCAVIFNASGYLHELLVKKQEGSFTERRAPRDKVVIQ